MPDASTDIAELAKQVTEIKTDDDHLSAVQAQVAYANEIFAGIMRVCAERNGLAGEALLRTLFEVVASAIILSKHHDKLKEFMRHGRFTELRMMRVIEVLALKERL